MGRALLTVMFVVTVLYGCGQASSPVEREEKQHGLDQEARQPGQATVKCEEFTSREAAQEYLDARATEGDAKAIDPDSNDKACDEGAYLFAGGSTTPSSTTASAPSSATASAGMSADEQAAQTEANCRLVTYVSEQNMSQQEGTELSERVADLMFEEMMDDPSLTAGPAQNAVLDDLNVPRYPECVGGEE